MASLSRIPAPSIPFGIAPHDLTLDEYAERISAAQRRFSEFDIDCLVVYSDREAFGDLCFLTGTDPRFEEAIYVLGPCGRGTLLLGNENFNQGPARELGIEVLLYQALSPAGQVRTSPVRLSDLLTDAGIEPGSRVGVAGGKSVAADFISDAPSAITAPSYLVDTLRAVATSTGRVTNAEDLFTHPQTGLRSKSSAHQIALFEYGAAVASHSVLGAMRALRIGIAANDLADVLIDRGLPHTCHSMINFGAKQGLYSPSTNTAKLGDTATIAQGLRGGLTCRGGVLASGPNDLREDARTIFPALVNNYFDVVAKWHETIALGVTTGAVFAAVEQTRDSAIYEFALNPGHFLHLEEWSQSSLEPGSTVTLQSGAMLQCDIIPALARPNIFINIEDGVAIADEDLRNELANDYPDLWERVEKRRSYLADVIGVALDNSVLPMSSMPLYHTPYFLDSSFALTR